MTPTSTARGVIDGGSVWNGGAVILKAKTGWKYNANGNDRIGFSALPGGIYANNEFNSIGENGGWWVVEGYQSEYNAAFHFWMTSNVGYGSDNLNVKVEGSQQKYGLSVRCVQDLRADDVSDDLTIRVESVKNEMSLADRNGVEVEKKATLTDIRDGREYNKEAKIREFLEKKEKEQKDRGVATDRNRSKDAKLDVTITEYEKLLESCAYKKSGQCSDVLYTLGALYYDQGRENFNKAMERYPIALEQYAAALEKYNNSNIGTPPKKPVLPVLDFSKSLKMYWQLSRDYPTYSKLPGVYYQMSENYLMAGHLDTALIILKQLILRFPKNQYVSSAQFLLGELAFMDNHLNIAFEHFKRVNKKHIDIVSWEMNHFRLGECAYIIGEFRKAKEYFRDYVKACDKGEYLKKEFREKALEYIGKIDKMR